MRKVGSVVMGLTWQTGRLGSKKIGVVDPGKNFGTFRRYYIFPHSFQGWRYSTASVPARLLPQFYPYHTHSRLPVLQQGLSNAVSG
jgi:hypothetical protein